MADLLSAVDLPGGFEYPREFVRVVELGLTNIEPWWIIDGERLRHRFAALRDRYPERSLVPFAIRQDNDDVACWDTAAGNVAVVHDFASPGHEQRSEFGDFYSWVQAGGRGLHRVRVSVSRDSRDTEQPPQAGVSRDTTTAATDAGEPSAGT